MSLPKNKAEKFIDDIVMKIFVDSTLKSRNEELFRVHKRVDQHIERIKNDSWNWSPRESIKL